MEHIDFVVLWVDGSDEKWLAEKNKYSNKKIDIVNDAKKYRDYDTLKFVFRSIETFAPWVNKVHLVTYGHLPKWLNTNNPKLNIVKHEEFIPNEYLPTFNSHTIELNLHKIKGLSDKFVYFNDDMLLTKPISSDFFFKNGLPCDNWQEDILVTDKTTDLNFSHILLNDLKLLNSNFNKRNCIKNNFSKWFTLKSGKGLIKNLLLYSWKNIAGFHIFHTPSPMLKQTFDEVWEKEYDILHKTCITKFREGTDVNQYAITQWQIYSGKFSVKQSKEMGKCFTLSDDNKEIHNFMKNPDQKMICINDGDVKNFEKVKKELNDSLEILLPNKSTFER